MLKSILRETCNKLNIAENVNVIDLGIVKDDGLAIDKAITSAISERECHIIITSGGVSMGEMDLIKPYIENRGKVLFGRVNMKPGKPTTFGLIDQTLVFALPGNPVSSFVTANLFLPLTLLALLDRPYFYDIKQ
jgi:gephyrin